MKLSNYLPLKCIVMEVNHAEPVQEGSILEGRAKKIF